MQRRNFLSAILLAGTAPAIVKASSLMKIIVTSQNIIAPRFGGFIDSLTITRSINDFTVEGYIYPDKLTIKGVSRGCTRPIYHVDELGWFDPLNKVR